MSSWLRPPRWLAVVVMLAGTSALACSNDGDESGSASPASAPSEANAPPEAASTSPIAPEGSDPAGSSAPTAPATPAPHASTTTTPATTTVPPRSVAPAPSNGCSATTVSIGDSTQPFTANGLTGSYLTHVPSTAMAGQALPLVIDLHGYSEPVAVHVIQSGLATYGETAGFVTVAPSVERPVPLWHPAVGSDDSVFLSELLDELEAALCLDTNRIYVAGLSHGAFMTSIVACDLSERIAAVAPVAGLRAPTDCAAARTVPVVAFHGTNDPFIPYEGGFGTSVASLPTPDGSGTLGSADQGTAAATADTMDDMSDSSDVWRPVPERTAIWATRNGCDPTPTEEAVADDVTRLTFACPPGAEVVLYRVADGGHSWPGSEFSKSIESFVGRTTSSISANDIMWAFFQDHPLRSA